MSFDHLAPGTPEDAWRSAGLDALPALTASTTRLVVLAAHPDDETLGAGGLIAATARLGADVDVVIATDGEASHPDSPTRTPADLAQTRRREVRSAVMRLAPRARLHHLALPDGGLQAHVDTLSDALRQIVGDTPVRLMSTWRGDRHPDHEACAEAAARVAEANGVEHWQCPIWWWHWGDPAASGPDRLRRFDLTEDDRAAKKAALAEHVSQHAPLSPQAGDEAILPPSVLAHFDRPYECFVVGAAPAAHPSYFDGLYARSADPWGLGARFYEQRKRELVLASLPRPRFVRAFEPGCATGLLSARLAERADELVAWDVAPAALDQASARLVGLAGVHVQRGRIPIEWPEGDFDLIVLSEVAYYCDDLALLVRRVLGSLRPDGIVVGCHWVRDAHDHPLTAADVHGAIDDGLIRLVHHVEDDFVLDVWGRDGRSVAEREGIA